MENKGTSDKRNSVYPPVPNASAPSQPYFFPPAPRVQARRAPRVRAPAVVPAVIPAAPFPIDPLLLSSSGPVVSGVSAGHVTGNGNSSAVGLVVPAPPNQVPAGNGGPGPVIAAGFAALHNAAFPLPAFAGLQIAPVPAVPAGVVVPAPPAPPAPQFNPHHPGQIAIILPNGQLASADTHRVMRYNDQVPVSGRASAYALRPVLRDIAFRGGRQMYAGNRVRGSYLEGTMAYCVGDEVLGNHRCTLRGLGNLGPFPLCVELPDKRHCAGCHYDSKQSNAHKLSEATFDNEIPNSVPISQLHHTIPTRLSEA
ncbi:hypothetical protein VTL71DRAFT_14971 [Oculimacula yallundae]|uniref:Uncharacterized protein n=1 Tax=Oculimacula yallundae TaxID=86028 RepID=A0ABR4CF98_9HELO